MSTKPERGSLEDIGAFVDTSGYSKKSKRSHSESTGDHEGEQEQKDEVEERLEALVFGKQPFQPTVGASAARHILESSDSEEFYDVPGDTGGPEVSKTDHVQQHLPPPPAWVDDDDEAISVDISAKPRTKKLRRSENETTISGTDYSKRLRTQFEKLVEQPEWASNVHSKRKRKTRRTVSTSETDSEAEEEDNEIGILQRTGDLLARSERLPKGVIDLKRMKDANSAKRAQAVVKSVEFHPTANVILTAGYHKTLDLFQIDGQKNPKLQSVHIGRFPISTAHFSRDGGEVIMAGQRKNFFVYDMMAGRITQIHGIRGRQERFFDKFVVSPDNQFLIFLGKDGYLPIVSNKTKQWIGDLKMNGTVRDAAFTPDSQYLLSIGSDGKVYIWDMSTRDCVHTFYDEGCLLGTKLCVSPDNHYVACGSDSGVVNVYSREQCFISGEESSSLGHNTEHPKPLKSVMNLITGIDSACFNSTSEILAIASQRKKDALKLVHLPSLSVFSNWPTKGTPLSYVTALDMSPQSQFLAIGNDKGKVLLYRLNHYYKGL